MKANNNVGLYEKIVDLAKSMRWKESNAKRQAEVYTEMVNKTIGQEDMYTANYYMNIVNDKLNEAYLCRCLARRLEDILKEEDDQ